MLRHVTAITALAAFVYAFSAVAAEKPPANKPGAATTPSAKTDAKMTAKWVEPEKKAALKAATVEVTVSGCELVDPSTTGEKPKSGQGHLHYQLDDGPMIATPTNKLSFHGLKSGDHKLVVMLANNDHSPMGPMETLTLKIP